LAPGASKNMTFNGVNIPATYVPVDGDYFLFVLIGDAGTVNERGMGVGGREFGAGA